MSGQQSPDKIPSESARKCLLKEKPARAEKGHSLSNLMPLTLFSIPHNSSMKGNIEWRRKLKSNFYFLLLFKAFSLELRKYLTVGWERRSGDRDAI